MKISFSIRSKEKNITQPEPFDISYDYRGHICTVIVHGDIKNPQVIIVPHQELPSIQVSRYWLFMNISWSKSDGFEFNQYSDPEITNSLSSPVGKLRSSDKIQINNGFLTLTFNAEVNQADLGNNESQIFLELCAKFGIRVADFKFSNRQIIYQLNCSRGNFLNVIFMDAALKNADFTGAKFTNVQFVKLNLEKTNFANCNFSKVEFLEVNLKGSIFDNCKVVHNKSRIDNDEILILRNCDLNTSSFIKATICSKVENSDLSSANFSEAHFVACKFYNCQLSQTIFSKSRFSSFTQGNNTKKQITGSTESINCCIGIKSENFSNQGAIIDCKFDNTSMKFIDISNNIIKNTDFEDADLYKAKLYNCEFIRTTFNGKTLKSANLSYADISFSKFKDRCNLNEVNLYRARMVDSVIESCELIGANFYQSDLKNSDFLKSNLTGVNFRAADLTLVSFDNCHLNGANFIQTRRGSLQFVSKLNNGDSKIQTIDTNQNGDNNSQENTIPNTCFFEYIEWSPERNGEIQIKKDDFLKIVSGQTSPFAVISKITKGNPGMAQIYLNNINQNQAEADASAKSAGNDLNDGSLNFDSDVESSDIHGSRFNINNDGVSAQYEDEENQEIPDFSSDISSDDEMSEEDE